MINCDYENYACRGGFAITAIEFLMNEGTTDSSCVDYINDQDTCRFQCDNTNDKYLKYYCKPNSMTINTDVYSIQRNIYNHGSVVVTVMVYEDIYNYKGGIYEYTTGERIG